MSRFHQNDFGEAGADEDDIAIGKTKFWKRVAVGVYWERSVTVGMIEE